MLVVRLVRHKRKGTSRTSQQIVDDWIHRWQPTDPLADHVGGKPGVVQELSEGREVRGQPVGICVLVVVKTVMKGVPPGLDRA